MTRVPPTHAVLDRSLVPELGASIPPLGDPRPGTATGVGSLPHRSAGEAARFAFAEYDLPAIPSLPRRSPAESMIAQAAVGIEGITAGQYGSLAVDARRVDPEAPAVTDLSGDGFRGMRAFLHCARANGYEGPVKWQFVGPVTLGVTLTRAGLPDELAFAVAARAVRSHLAAISATVALALPRSAQLITIDEPWFGELLSPGFPIAPEPAIDLLSGAMAAVSGRATVGIHCCARVDVASVLAAGPDVISLPGHPALANVAGYLGSFLGDAGRIAWGVVPTDGPLSLSVGRSWHQLHELWSVLVQRGVDADALRTRSLVTPHCGMGTHSPAVAERVCRTTREVGRRLAGWTPDARAPRGFA